MKKKDYYSKKLTFRWNKQLSHFFTILIFSTFISSIVQGQTPIIDDVTVENAASVSSNDGSLTITASGGTPPYQYSIDNGMTYQASNIFSDLMPGDYLVRVKDDLDVESLDGNPFIFFADKDGDDIHKGILDDSPTSSLLIGTANDIRRIQMDVINEKIYWTNNGGTIKMADLDGSNIADFYSGSGDYIGLELDVENGFMYFGDKDGNIHRTNLDGTGSPTILATVSGGTILDIELDATNQKLYFATGTEETINSMNVDGTGMTVIITIDNGNNNKAGSLELDIANDKLYYIALNYSLFSAGLDGSDNTLLFDANNSKPFHLADLRDIKLNPLNGNLIVAGEEDVLDFDLEDVENPSSLFGGFSFLFGLDSYKGSIYTVGVGLSNDWTLMPFSVSEAGESFTICDGNQVVTITDNFDLANTDGLVSLNNSTGAFDLCYPMPIKIDQFPSSSSSNGDTWTVTATGATWTTTGAQATTSGEDLDLVLNNVDGSGGESTPTSSVTIVKAPVSSGGGLIVSYDANACQTMIQEIDIQGAGMSIVNEDDTPDTSDDTDFGLIDQGNSDVHTFTIKNTGTKILNLTGSPIVDISGSNDFTISTQPTANSIDVGGADLTFEVTYTPSAAGMATAVVSIASDDCDENPYTFTVTGTGGMDNEVTPGTIGSDQMLCIDNNDPAMFTDEVSATAAGTLSYEWQFSTDNMNFMPLGKTNTATFNADPITETTYYRREATSTIGNNTVSEFSNVITVEIFELPTPAMAGSDADMCGISYQLMGNSPSVGMGLWTISNSSGPNPIIENADVPNAGLTRTDLTIDDLGEPINFTPQSYTMTWTISNGPCPNSEDMVTISSDMLSVHATGDATDVCDMSHSINGFTEGKTFASWQLVEDSEGTGMLTNPNNSMTDITFTGAIPTTPPTFVVRWQVTNGPCAGTYDDVTVSFSPDSDADTFQDCNDLCIGGDDRNNLDGVGIPDDCDCFVKSTFNEFVMMDNNELSQFLADNSGEVEPTRHADFQLTSNATIPDIGKNIVFKAGNNIILDSDFEIVLGAEFTALIEYCNDPFGKGFTETEASLRSSNANETSNTLGLKVIPTVINEEAIIQLDLLMDESLSLQIINQNGQPIRQFLKEKMFSAGQHHFRLNTANFPNGFYILQLHNDKTMIYQKIIVQH